MMSRLSSPAARPDRPLGHRCVSRTNQFTSTRIHIYAQILSCEVDTRSHGISSTWFAWSHKKCPHEYFGSNTNFSLIPNPCFKMTAKRQFPQLFNVCPAPVLGFSVGYYCHHSPTLKQKCFFVLQKYFTRFDVHLTDEWRQNPRYTAVTCSVLF